MKKILPHIQIGIDENERVILVIDDHELSDFIDDHLVEQCDLAPTHQGSSTRPGGEVITLYFDSSVELKQVEAALKNLDPVELERIYRINNPDQNPAQPS